MKNFAIQCMFWVSLAFLLPLGIVFLSNSSHFRKAISMLIVAGFWCLVAVVCYVCASLNKFSRDDDFRKGQSCRAMQLDLYKVVETERDVLKEKVAELNNLIKSQAQTNLSLEANNRKLEGDLFHEKRYASQVTSQLAPLKRELHQMKIEYRSLTDELERFKTNPKTEIGRLYKLSQLEVAGAKHTAQNLREAEQAAEDRATALEQQLQTVAADAYARGRQSLIEEAEQWVAAEKARLYEEAMSYITRLQNGQTQAEAQAPAAQTLSATSVSGSYHAGSSAPPVPMVSYTVTPTPISNIPAQPATLAARLVAPTLAPIPAPVVSAPAQPMPASRTGPQQVSSTLLDDGSGPRPKRVAR